MVKALHKFLEGTEEARASFGFNPTRLDPPTVNYRPQFLKKKNYFSPFLVLYKSPSIEESKADLKGRKPHKLLKSRKKIIKKNSNFGL